MSFPHALSGNPDESKAGCPIKAFGHDNFEISSKSKLHRDVQVLDASDFFYGSGDL